MQNPEVIINGESGNYISSLDRGLLYGDGVFETIAIKQGQPQFWHEHLKRLKFGCEKLKLSGLNTSLLKSELDELIDNDEQCIIKIIITRGVGERGYRPTQTSLTRVIQKFPWPEFPQKYLDIGIEVTMCNFRLAHQPELAQIKHLNRLEQVLARSEWKDEYQEGLVCDIYDQVIEATSSNVFFQIGDELITPSLEKCGVAGVMRGKVIEYCNTNDLQLKIKDFAVDELQTIQGMFVCNSIIGIWPVYRLHDLSLSKTAIIQGLMSVFNT